MTIDAEPIWQDRFASIPPTDRKDWAKPIATEMDARVTSKAQISNITGQVNFTFNKDVFEKQLYQLQLSKTYDAPAIQQATAWATAIQASTIIVAPGAFFQSASPSTTFSSITSSLIDPDSISAAQQTLKQNILNAPLVKNAKDDKIPPAYRKAFLQLTVTIIGMSSDTPNPVPLTVPKLPII